MADTAPAPPLDLSAFDDVGPQAGLPAVPLPSAVADANARLAPQPRPARLVEVDKLSADDLAASSQAASAIDFRHTATLLSHGENVLAGIAQASRQLLSGVRLGDAGEIGHVAAKRPRRRRRAPARPPGRGRRPPGAACSAG